eukprot:Clim_evm40s235 gene=Clim_evmTU40s235
MNTGPGSSRTSSGRPGSGFGSKPASGYRRDGYGAPASRGRPTSGTYRGRSSRAGTTPLGPPPTPGATAARAATSSFTRSTSGSNIAASQGAVSQPSSSGSSGRMGSYASALRGQGTATLSSARLENATTATTKDSDVQAAGGATTGSSNGGTGKNTNPPAPLIPPTVDAEFQQHIDSFLQDATSSILAAPLSGGFDPNMPLPLMPPQFNAMQGGNSKDAKRSPSRVNANASNETDDWGARAAAQRKRQDDPSQEANDMQGTKNDDMGKDVNDQEVPNNQFYGNDVGNTGGQWNNFQQNNWQSVSQRESYGYPANTAMNARWPAANFGMTFGMGAAQGAGFGFQPQADNQQYRSDFMGMTPTPMIDNGLLETGLTAARQQSFPVSDGGMPDVYQDMGYEAPYGVGVQNNLGDVAGRANYGQDPGRGLSGPGGRMGLNDQSLDVGGSYGPHSNDGSYGAGSGSMGINDRALDAGQEVPANPYKAYKDAQGHLRLPLEYYDELGRVQLYYATVREAQDILGLTKPEILEHYISMGMLEPWEPRKGGQSQDDEVNNDVVEEQANGEGRIGQGQNQRGNDKDLRDVINERRTKDTKKTKEDQGLQSGGKVRPGFGKDGPKDEMVTQVRVRAPGQTGGITATTVMVVGNVKEGKIFKEDAPPTRDGKGKNKKGQERAVNDGTKGGRNKKDTSFPSTIGSNAAPVLFRPPKADNGSNGNNEKKKGKDGNGKSKLEDRKPEKGKKDGKSDRKDSKPEKKDVKPEKKDVKPEKKADKKDDKKDARKDAKKDGKNNDKKDAKKDGKKDVNTDDKRDIKAEDKKEAKADDKKEAKEAAKEAKLKEKRERQAKTKERKEQSKAKKQEQKENERTAHNIVDVAVKNALSYTSMTEQSA